MRNPNTNTRGGGFDALTIAAVWNKARVIPGVDPGIMRRDCCGAAIMRSRYGQTVQYGWEIDHITPVAKNGSDSLSNLQPLQWQNNRYKGDTYPNWSCALGA